jgi:hypothetical protein
MVNYTGVRKRTGETLFTTKGIGQPLSLDVEHAAPAFSDAPATAAQERAGGATGAGDGNAVYEIKAAEVVRSSGREAGERGR